MQNTSMTFRYLLVFLAIGILFTACRTDNAPVVTTPTEKAIIPTFNADSSYQFLKDQLDFGFRIPGTPEHAACKDYFIEKLESYGFQVQVQKFEETIFTGTKMQGYNVIAQYKPKMPRRVALAAHWDSRIIADKDADPENHDDPIMGADDGASGVAALLEIARSISENPINLGVDIFLWDVEDQGDMNGDVKTWALGSQYWAKNITPKNYKADFGILLDMIAAKGAKFGREQYSMDSASDIMNKVWQLAQTMGYSDLFKDYKAGHIADDHVYMNQAGIRTIDIINIPRPSNRESTFGHYHHTIKDDINIIDKRNLRVVGQVVLAVLYRYSDGRF